MNVILYFFVKLKNMNSNERICIYIYSRLGLRSLDAFYNIHIKKRFSPTSKCFMVITEHVI